MATISFEREITLTPRAVDNLVKIMQKPKHEEQETNSNVMNELEEGKKLLKQLNDIRRMNMSNKEEISKMVRGELTIGEADKLYKKLHSRTEREIINDLKEDVNLEGLLNTKNCIEESIKSNPELDTEEVRKSLGYINKAIKELQ